MRQNNRLLLDLIRCVAIQIVRTHFFSSLPPKSPPPRIPNRETEEEEIPRENGIPAETQENPETRRNKFRTRDLIVK